MKKHYENDVITVDREDKANQGIQLLREDLDDGFEIVRADATDDYIVYVLRREVELPEGYSSWKEYSEKTKNITEDFLGKTDNE